MFSTDKPPTTPAPWADTSSSEAAAPPSWIAPFTRPPQSEGDPSSIDNKEEAFSSSPPDEGPSTTAAGMVPSPVPPPVEIDFEAEIAQLQGQLSALMQSTERARHEILQASERDLVRLALVVAAKVVGRELTTDPAIVALWARQGLEALEGQDNLEIIISPDIAKAVPDDAWTTAGGQSITPRVDPELPPGSCLVRGEFTRIDASLTTRMNTIAEAMGAPED